MQFSLRFFTDNDYGAMHDILHAISADETSTREELRYKDQNRDPRCHFQRWVVEKEGTVLAIGEYDQDAQRYDPRAFLIDGMVHPAFQQQGIGDLLYTHIMARIQSFRPLWVRKRVRVDQEAGLRFLRKRGFQEKRRLWVSRLDLAAYDSPSPIEYKEQLSRQDMTIKTFKDLSCDPGRNQKLYHLVNELAQDVPSPEPRLIPSYEDYVKYHLYHPHLLPEGYFVACQGNDYIGLSELKTTERASILTTGLTAIKRLYRRRGIAHSLKEQSIVYAKAHEYQALWTSNDVRNLPILALNERLGFVRQYAWIELIKSL